MKKKHISLEIEVFDEEGQLSEMEQLLLSKARQACDHAYAPYSAFHVGAAVHLENGEILTGNNQENAAFPSGLCAERVALFWAGANYPGIPIRTIAIAARHQASETFLPVTPCGGCRQVMAEYENKQKEPISLILEGEDRKIYRIRSVAFLLPLQFSRESLKRK
jgi:cytidine deaminase